MNKNIYIYVSVAILLKLFCSSYIVHSMATSFFAQLLEPLPEARTRRLGGGWRQRAKAKAEAARDDRSRSPQQTALHTVLGMLKAWGAGTCTGPELWSNTKNKTK